MCVHKSAHLLTQGRVISPCSLSWHQLVCRNVKQIPAGDSLLLTDHRKKIIITNCAFSLAVPPLPDSCLGCLPLSTRWNPGQNWVPWNAKGLALQGLTAFSSLELQREQGQSHLLCYWVCLTECRSPPSDRLRLIGWAVSCPALMLFVFCIS